MPPNIDLAAFSDSSFEPKRWINEVTRNLASGESMERCCPHRVHPDHLCKCARASPNAFRYSRCSSTASPYVLLTDLASMQLSNGPGAPSTPGSRGCGCRTGNGQCKGPAADPCCCTGDNASESRFRQILNVLQHHVQTICFLKLPCLQCPTL